MSITESRIAPAELFPLTKAIALFPGNTNGQRRPIRPAAESPPNSGFAVPPAAGTDHIPLNEPM
jgi:hypothetical protein